MKLVSVAILAVLVLPSVAQAQGQPDSVPSVTDDATLPPRKPIPPAAKPNNDSKWYLMPGFAISAGGDDHVAVQALVDVGHRVADSPLWTHAMFGLGSNAYFPQTMAASNDVYSDGVAWQARAGLDLRGCGVDVEELTTGGICLSIGLDAGYRHVSTNGADGHAPKSTGDGIFVPHLGFEIAGGPVRVRLNLPEVTVTTSGDLAIGGSLSIGRQW